MRRTVRLPGRVGTATMAALVLGGSLSAAVLSSTAAAADTTPVVTTTTPSVDSANGGTATPSASQAASTSSSSSSSPSTSSTPTPTTTPTPKVTDDDESGHDQGLTEAQLRAQLAQATALLAQFRASNAEIATALARTDALAKQANDILAKLAVARDVLAEASLEAARNEELSASLRAELDQANQMLRDWAFYAYTEGGSVADFTGVIDSLDTDPAKSGNPIGDLHYLTQERSQLQDRIVHLAASQAAATKRATAARDLASRTERSIAADKAVLDKALTAQKAQLAALRTAQAGNLAKAGPLVALLVGVQTPEAKAAYDELMAELTRAGQDAADIGGTCSNDEGVYANGMLPASALCPLWQAPGESLRPRAAAAFNALSRAYAKATGSPICVTDSYRTLSEQYAVKARRGGWAATPGTSPHGLGRALDLCGGIGSFGTPQHLWMKQNAPLYGWYHPSWAEPGGSLPEPWHWEFGN